MTAEAAQIVVALGLLCAVLVVWGRVQLAWRRTFPDPLGEPDALVGRMGCHACERSADCEARLADGGPQEEPR